MKKRILPSFFTCFISVLIFFLPACSPDDKREIAVILSDAEGVVSNLRASDDTRIVNGEPDYGWNIQFTVKNVGKSGMIKVSPWISCSDGEWQKSQKFAFLKREKAVICLTFSTSQQFTLVMDNMGCKFIQGKGINRYVIPSFHIPLV